MHFRVRKNVIQLIRIKYNDGKKKGVNTIIGTVKLAKPELSADLRNKLSDDEVGAFEAWISTQLRTDMLREEMAALTLAETIELAGKWFQREGNSGAAQTVSRDIISQWQGMRRIFSKNGLLE